MSEYLPIGPDDKMPMPYAPGPGERRGSGCLKVFVITAIVVVLGSVACCAGGAFWLYKGTVQEPDDIRRIADEIIDWEFNDAFTPVFGIETFPVRWVILAGPDPGGLLMIQSRFFPREYDGDQFRKSFGLDFSFDDTEKEEEKEVLERTERPLEIRGEQVVMIFERTRVVRTGQIYWEVAGVIPGEPGPILLGLQLDADAWTDEMIEDRLRSIR